MKYYPRIRLLTAVLFAGVLIPVFTANAGWVTLQLPYAEYGHVYNTDSGLAGGNPVPWCAPTATANSFQFLESHYPAVYGNSLTGGNVIGLRNTLATGWLSPGGTQRSGMVSSPVGATDKDWWEHKVWYIEDYAPNTTVFAGMIESNPAGWHRGGDLVWGSPTWDFLWNEVADSEDVELKIDIGTSVAHALTLTSMKFDDQDGDLQWDLGEARDIDYLDPNNPSQLFTGAVQQNLAGTRLQFWWNNGAGGANQWATIEGAYTESPIPEPAVLSLLVLGIVALLRRRLFA